MGLLTLRCKNTIFLINYPYAVNKSFYSSKQLYKLAVWKIEESEESLKKKLLLTPKQHQALTESEKPLMGDKAI